MDDHVTNSTGLKCDPIDYSGYKKVVGLCLGGHHEYFRNHHEGEMEQASLKYLWKPQNVETESHG